MNRIWRAYPMYAIAFDLDNETLSKTYTNPSYPNAYTEIKTVLGRYGFSRQQGGVYFGDENTNAVIAVMAVQELAKIYPWFAPSVKDIRMLRIEDNNDLKPAIEMIIRQ